MQIVIEIPEEEYKRMKEKSMFGRVDIWKDAIRNGVPLPQPFDLDGLKSDMKALNCGYPYGLDYLLDCLKKRLGITIIEADKEDDDGDSN